VSNSSDQSEPLGATHLTEAEQREAMYIGDAWSKALDGFVMTHAEDVGKPIHLPHAVFIWCEHLYELMKKAVVVNAVTGGSSDTRDDLIISHLATAFLTGYTLVKEGGDFTPCRCGDLKASNVEEFLGGGDTSGQPTQEQAE